MIRGALERERDRSGRQGSCGAAPPVPRQDEPWCSRAGSATVTAVNFDPTTGVFQVRYDDPAALAPAAQRELESAVRRAAAEAPVGIVFAVGPAVQAVTHEVPDYWLGLTAGGVRIAAIAVVTRHPAVSVATRGFSAANILKDTSVAVKPFGDEAEALAWAKAQVAAARAKR